MFVARQPFLKTVREFLYGMLGYEFEEHAMELRGSLETLFMSITFGDMLGLPIIPPYYTLRVLPYVVPNIARLETPRLPRARFWRRPRF